MQDGHHMQQILKVYAQTRSRGEEIDWKKPSSEIVRIARKNQDLYIYIKDEIYFCFFKTKFENNEGKMKDAVLMVFSFKLPGPVTGSSSASEMVMNIVSVMEKRLYPIEYSHFEKEYSTKNENIGLLKLIKYINDEDNE